MKIKIKSIIIGIVIFLMNLLTFSYKWCESQFGNIGFNEIIFTINMPLKGTATNYFYSYFISAFLPAVIAFIIEVIIISLPISKRYVVNIIIMNKKKIRLTVFPLRIYSMIWIGVCVVWMYILISFADQRFGIFDFIKNQMENSSFIEEYYVDADDVDIVFPDQKRNLIWIYMESAETSMQDTENGGLMDFNLIPEMTEIAKNNITFSESELVEGATVAPACGWTIAGLVAQTSGLPLKLYGYDENNIDNSMEDYVYFMPGAVSLGDILEKEGYHNVFMAGSDMDFAGRRQYFEQHGNYEIIDYYTMIENGKLSEDYYVGWGFEDSKLYEFAKEELLELASEEQPFNLSLITVDTHADAKRCELCPDIYDNDYYNMWACASKQVYEFVEWIQEQDFYENTVICISGDHCSMQIGILDEYDVDKHEGGGVRRVYNAIINSAIEPIKSNNRNFATLDMYPTVLASMGVKIEGERLGLGTNLFSEMPTLLEEYGDEFVFAELDKGSDFYNNKILYYK